MADELLGRVIGKYELRERIGRGGMAEVYKAYQSSLDRFIALKVLHPFLGEDPEFKQRFEGEARNVGQLHHPNIVQVYDFDYDANRDLYYMVMEFVDGPTLRSRLTQYNFHGERFALPEATAIVSDVASALAYAHKRNMVHRDIKPANIMLDKDGRVVLTDFGIARIVSSTHMTASGSMVGTPAYMSPEQGLGQSGDRRSDIYSLGVVLYQLVTGTTPYDADTPIAIVLKHVNEQLPPPSAINPDVPEALERILYKALAKSPDARYQHVEDFRQDLQNLDGPSTLILAPPVADQIIHQQAMIQTGGLVSPPSDSSALSLSKEPKIRSGCGMLVGALLLSLLAFGAGSYTAFMGLLSNAIPYLPSIDIVLTNTPSIQTDTQEDLFATGTANPPLTQDLQPNLQPTSNESSLDLTETTAACDYDYELISQTPPEGDLYPAATSLTKRILIVNDSRCDLDDDLRFVFVAGFQMEAPNFIELDRRLRPGEQFAIVLDMKTPAYNASNPLVTSTWKFVLPDGTQVGPEYTFSLTLFAADTTPDTQPTLNPTDTDPTEPPSEDTGVPTQPAATGSIATPQP